MKIISAVVYKPQLQTALEKKTAAHIQYVIDQ